MNRKVVFSALLVTGAVLLAAGAYAQMRGQRGMGGRRFGRGPSLAEASAKLGLTQSKQRQIDQILSAEQRAGDEGDTERRGRRGGRSDNRRALEQFRQVLNEQEYAQLEELLTGPGRAEKVGRFFRELQSVGLNIKQEAVVEKIVDEAMAKVRRSLTLDQRSKLTAALERPERGFGRGRGGDAMRQRWQQLSEEQREELAKAREGYWEKMSEAETPEERRELREEMRRKMSDILDQDREQPEEESSEEPSEEDEEEEE